MYTRAPASRFYLEAGTPGFPIVFRTASTLPPILSESLASQELTACDRLDCCCSTFGRFALLWRKSRQYSVLLHNNHSTVSRSMQPTLCLRRLRDLCLKRVSPFSSLCFRPAAFTRSLGHQLFNSLRTSFRFVRLLPRFQPRSRS